MSIFEKSLVDLEKGSKICHRDWNAQNPKKIIMEL